MFAIAKKMRESRNYDIREIPLESLNENPHPHSTLPIYMVIACRLIAEVFEDVLELDYVDMLKNFTKDYDYLHEFVVWSVMANAYIEFIRETHCPYDDTKKKKEVFEVLLNYSLGYPFNPESSKYKYVTEQEQVYLVSSYQSNYMHITKMIDNIT